MVLQAAGCWRLHAGAAQVVEALLAEIRSRHLRRSPRLVRSLSLITVAHGHTRSFCQTMVEDPTMNRMFDSLQLFHDSAFPTPPARILNANHLLRLSALAHSLSERQLANAAEDRHSQQGRFVPAEAERRAGHIPEAVSTVRLSQSQSALTWQIAASLAMAQRSRARSTASAKLSFALRRRRHSRRSAHKLCPVPAPLAPSAPGRRIRA